MPFDKPYMISYPPSIVTMSAIVDANLFRQLWDPRCDLWWAHLFRGRTSLLLLGRWKHSLHHWSL